MGRSISDHVSVCMCVLCVCLGSVLVDFVHVDTLMSHNSRLCLFFCV